MSFLGSAAGVSEAEAGGGGGGETFGPSSFLEKDFVDLAEEEAFFATAVAATAEATGAAW